MTSHPTQKCVLSIDLGSSGPKVSIISQEGGIVATRSGHFDSQYSQNGKAVEQDAEAWWSQIVQLAKEILEESGVAKNIIAISTCAQYFTSVPVDENGNAVHNAIMWEDARASPHIKKIMGGFPSILGYNVFKLLRWLHKVGIPPILSGVDGGSHMLLLKNELPEVWKKTYKVLEPSDFLSLKLTGKFHTNENTGFAYTLINKAPWSKGTFNKKLIRFLGLDESRFPDILPVGTDLGKPKQAIIDYWGLSDNVTVLSGMQDTTACILGGGAFSDLDMVIEVGTTLNTGVVVNRRIIDVLNGIYSVSSPVPNKYILVGEAGAGAKALNYLLHQFLRVEDSLSRINAETDAHYAKIADDMAALSPIGNNGVIFLPWIFGSTFPEQDLNMRGGFINLSPENSRNDMIRAVFESYAMNFKWVLEIKEKTLKQKIEKVSFTGGGALWETAAQICADALKVPVLVMDEPRQANTKGIAYMCFNNLGIVSYEEMRSKLKVQKTFYPQKENFAFYDKRLKFYKELYKTMRPLYAKLNQ
jgi:xylulokinase